MVTMMGNMLEMVTIIWMLLERWLPPTCFRALPPCSCLLPERKQWELWKVMRIEICKQMREIKMWKKMGGRRWVFKIRVRWLPATCSLDLQLLRIAVWEEAMWILKSQGNNKENEENVENGFWNEENEDDNVEKMGLGNSDPTTCFLDLQLQRSGRKEWEFLEPALEDFFFPLSTISNQTWVIHKWSQHVSS